MHLIFARGESLSVFLCPWLDWPKCPGMETNFGRYDAVFVLLQSFFKDSSLHQCSAEDCRSEGPTIWVTHFSARVYLERHGKTSSSEQPVSPLWNDFTGWAYRRPCRLVLAAK